MHWAFNSTWSIKNNAVTTRSPFSYRNNIDYTKYPAVGNTACHLFNRSNKNGVGNMWYE